MVRALFLGTSLLIITTLLTSCGFHLRGSHDIPASASPLHIQSGGQNLRANIRRILLASEIEVTESKDEANLILRILTESRDTRTLSVDDRGKIIESELHYRVKFDSVDNAGNSKVAEQTVDLIRSILNTDIEVLGKQEETNMLNADMELDMADRIIFRLRAQLK